MRSVLYDMQIAEAMVEVNNESYRTHAERKTLYDAVFAKHRITQADYDSALVWYAEHLDLYMQVYRMALKDIDARIAEVGADVKPNPLSGEASNKDSIDVWIDDRSYAFKPERVYNALAFDIMPQKPYSSGSSYVLGLSIWGVSPDWKCKPEIYMQAIQPDTVITVRYEIPCDGYYETPLMTAAAKQVSRIRGYIFLNEAGSAYHRVYLDHLRLMKYNYGSKALTAPQPAATQKADSAAVATN